VLRPANYPQGTPGYGWIVLETKKGKVASDEPARPRFDGPSSWTIPSRWPRELVEEIRKETPVIFVDFHAEATSEKGSHGLALGWQSERRRRHAHACPYRR